MSRDDSHGGKGWAFTECLWAPTKTKGSARDWPFWTNVRDVRADDIILHLRGIPPTANFVGYSQAAGDGVETLGHLRVAFPVGRKVFEILEGGDQFALAFFRSDVLDGVANGHHRVVVHHVMEIAVRNGDEIAEPDLVLRPAVMNGDGLGATVKMMVIRLELGLEPFRRGLFAARFC